MISRIILSLFCLSLSAALAQPFTLEDYLSTGTTAFAQGDCQLAQHVFQRALELDSNNIQALLGKGRALVCQGRPDLAFEDYRRVSALDPNNVEAYIQLATAYRNHYLQDPLRNSGSLEQALNAALTAERINASDPRALNIKGVILFQTERFGEARDAFERAIALAPAATLPPMDISRIQVNLGRVYRELGQPQQSLTVFRRAVTSDPTNFEAHLNLGMAYYRADNCDDAIFELTQAANLAPNSLEAVSNLAIALFECGEVEASVPRILQAIDIDGVSIPALYTYLAEVYISQGRYADAVREAQKGALLPPTNANALFVLGRAYAAAGNNASAREAYNRSLELDPQFARAREALSTLP